MKRGIMVVLLLVAVCEVAMAQSEIAKILMDTPYKKIELKEIEAQVMTPNAKYYYPQLYERYEKGDTSLTYEDYRHLYYGYIYQAEYQPHKESPYVDSLSNLLNKNSAEFNIMNASKSIEYLDKILEDRPFSLKFLNMMVYLYNQQIRDGDKALLYAYKFNMLLSTIFSSGDGKSKDRPWLVLYRSDAMSILQFIGADVTKRIYITANIEFYNLREKQGDVRGYYFDFDPIYLRPYEPKGKRKMEINPLYNPKSDKYINTKIK